MGLKRWFVLVNLVNPNPILVVSVLNHVKSQTPGLIVDGSTCVLLHPGDELFPVSFLDLERGDYYVDGASLYD